MLVATVTVSVSQASSFEDRHVHQGARVSCQLALHSCVWTALPFRVVPVQMLFGLARTVVASGQRRIAMTVPPELDGRVASVVVVLLGEGT